MTDITMCDSIGQQGQCPMREWCYRYTATPNEFRQAFFTVAPFEDENTCDYYTPNGRGSETEYVGDK